MRYIGSVLMKEKVSECPGVFMQALVYVKAASLRGSVGHASVDMDSIGVKPFKRHRVCKL